MDLDQGMGQVDLDLGLGPVACELGSWVKGMDLSPWTCAMGTDLDLDQGCDLGQRPHAIGFLELSCRFGNGSYS